MTDETSSGDKGKPNEGIPEASLQADIGVVAANETPNEKNQSQSANQNVTKPKKPWMAWRILKIPGDCWKELKKPEVTNRVIAMFTIVIAITGIVYTVFAGFQWGVMSGQLDEMKRSEEPYVAVESFNVHNFPDGDQPSFTLTFRNYGHGLATHVFGNITMVQSPNELNQFQITSDFMLPVLPGNPSSFSPAGDFTLLPIPGESPRGYWAVMSPVWQQHRDAVKSGKEWFYVMGYIEYDDRDGKRFPLQRLCFVYSREPGRPTEFGPFDNCKGVLDTE